MLKSVLHTFISKGLIAALNLAILLISSKLLGGEIIGQVSLLIVNITIIQIINEIYTGYALVHYIPKLPVNKLYKTGFLWTISCVLFLNVIFWLFKIGNESLAIHCSILSFGIILNSFNLVILLGKERIKIYNILQTMQPLILLSSLLFSIFVLKQKTVFSYVYSLYPAYFIPLIFSSIAVITTLKNTEEESNKINVSSIVKTGFVNQLGNLAHTLSNRYNYYFIGSNLLVGLYSNATSLIESTWIIGGSITPILLSKVANSKDQNIYGTTTLLFSKLSFLLSLLCVVLLALLPNELFTFILGKDFSQIKTIMLCLAPGILCISFSVIISHYFSAKGIQKVQLIANLSGLLITFTLSYYMISHYQLIGACIVASLAYFIQSLVVTVFFLKEQKLNLPEFLSLRQDMLLFKSLLKK